MRAMISMNMIYKYNNECVIVSLASFLRGDCAEEKLGGGLSGISFGNGGNQLMQGIYLTCLGNLVSIFYFPPTARR